MNFKANLIWRFKEAAKDKSSKVYAKSHTVSVEGKPTLPVSAAKQFKGDPALYNPEDLLLSSLMSCHMMSYLYCCQINDIEVISYNDEAEATLELNSDGSGRITKAVLKPNVIIKEASKIELALALHRKANQLCFIANSCNFPVVHQATCSSE